MLQARGPVHSHSIGSSVAKFNLPHNAHFMGRLMVHTFHSLFFTTIPLLSEYCSVGMFCLMFMQGTTDISSLYVV